MKRGSQIILVFVILAAIGLFLNNFTGSASRSFGFTSFRSDRDISVIEIISGDVDEETGLPIVQAGKVLKIKIWPSRQGVRSGLAIFRGDLLKEGKLASRDSSLDFCSTSYVCLEEENSDCKAGPECFGGKLVTIRIPRTWEPGVYNAAVCDATSVLNTDAGRCPNTLRSYFLVTQLPDDLKGKKLYRGDETIFRGKTGML